MLLLESLQSGSTVLLHKCCFFYDTFNINIWLAVFIGLLVFFKIMTSEFINTGYWVLNNPLAIYMYHRWILKACYSRGKSF